MCPPLTASDSSANERCVREMQHNISSGDGGSSVRSEAGDSWLQPRPSFLRACHPGASFVGTCQPSRFSTLGYALLAYGIIAAGWRWASTFLRQRQQVADGWWSWPFSDRDITRGCYEMFFNTELHSFHQTHAIIVACVCALVVLSVLINPKVGEWYVLSMTVLPIGMACAVSAYGRNIFIPRYLAFIQPFVLASLAVLLCRIPDDVLAGSVAFIVAVMGIGVHLDFVDSMEIGKKPGAHTAAAYIDASRQDGEPVIACSGLLYFPMLYHAGNRKDWHVYGEEELLHYVGGPGIVASERVDRSSMDAIDSKRAWVVTTSGGWGRRDMYIPEALAKKDRGSLFGSEPNAAGRDRAALRGFAARRKEKGR